jgi:AraC-like DNA-binding protein
VPARRTLTCSIRALLPPLFAAARTDAERAALLSRCGVDPGLLTRPDERVPADRLPLAFEVGAAASGDHHHGLHVASRGDPARLDLVAHLVTSSSTVRQGVELFGRYVRLFSEATSVGLDDRADRPFVRIDPSLPMDRGSPGWRHMFESATATCVDLLGRVLGEAVAPREVRFMTSAPVPADELERFFRAPVTFDREFTGVGLEPEWLDRPGPGGNPAILAVLERYASELSARLPAAEDPISHRVRAWALRAIGPRPVSLRDAARALGVSDRSLQRALGEEGLTFKAVVDDARAALARRHLEDSRLAIGEVGFLLGFQEVSAFYRAFRRWTGTTPLDFRRSGRPV